ncbi:hypothetical protein ACGF3G_08965 [Streptomyces sp. NPDC048179]|uniref:hypothetical protein n=1 Tax=Streptomyces sp. NPDC048179 TaxID=3365506 RepID=UPI003717986E
MHTRPVTCDFTTHAAQGRTGQTVRSDAYTRDQFISLAENASALPDWVDKHDKEHPDDRAKDNSEHGQPPAKGPDGTQTTEKGDGGTEQGGTDQGGTDQGGAPADDGGAEQPADQGGNADQGGAPVGDQGAGADVAGVGVAAEVWG